MRCLIARLLGLALAFAATPAAALDCNNPAAIEQLYDRTEKQPTDTTNLAQMKAKRATLQASAVMLWQLRGRDDAARSGRVTYWAARLYGLGSDGFPKDEALSEAIYDGYSNGRAVQIFRSRAPTRPPAEAVRLAREVLNCGSAQAPAPAPRMASTAPRASTKRSTGPYTPASFEEARTLFERGLNLTRNNPTAGQYSSARDAYGKSCNWGLGAACAQLGSLLSNGRGGPVDKALAFTAYQRGCSPPDITYSNGAACYNYAQFLQSGEGGAKKNSSGALIAFKRGCVLRLAIACTSAGSMLATGAPGVAKNPQSSVEWLSKGCDLGYASACSFATSQVFLGDGVAKDFPAALAFSKKGCAAKDGIQCFLVGDLIERGVAADPGRGTPKSYYLQACQHRVMMKGVDETDSVIDCATGTNIERR